MNSLTERRKQAYESQRNHQPRICISLPVRLPLDKGLDPGPKAPPGKPPHADISSGGLVACNCTRQDVCSKKIVYCRTVINKESTFLKQQCVIILLTDRQPYPTINTGYASVTPTKVGSMWGQICPSFCLTICLLQLAKQQN